MIDVGRDDVDITGCCSDVPTTAGEARPRSESRTTLKYVILIHSNPQPWGHPTGEYVAEYQALPAEERARFDEAFERELARMQENGELVGGEALADAAAARLYRWEAGRQQVTDGPYSEAKEHLAGFFLIDVESQQRAEEVAAAFSGPGETVELRPVMWPGGQEG